MSVIGEELVSLIFIGLGVFIPLLVSVKLSKPVIGTSNPFTTNSRTPLCSTNSPHSPPVALPPPSGSLLITVRVPVFWLAKNGSPPPPVGSKRTVTLRVSSPTRSVIGNIVGAMTLNGGVALAPIPLITNGHVPLLRITSILSEKQPKPPGSATVAGKAYIPSRFGGSSTMLGSPTEAVIGNVIIGVSGSSVVITRLQSGSIRSSGVNSTSKLKQKSLLIVKGKAGGFMIVKSSQPSVPGSAPGTKATAVTVRLHLPVLHTSIVSALVSPIQS